MILRKYINIVICAIFLISCSCNKEPKLTEKVHFSRFEDALFSKNLDEINDQFPIFTRFFTKEIVKAGDPVSKDFDSLYYEKFINEYKSTLFDSVKKVFPNMQNTEAVLGKALGYYKTYFPNDSLPVLYTHISGFNKPIVSVDSIISVSLDKYLGNSSYYHKMGIYEYLLIGMYPKKIPLDIIKVLAYKKIPQENSSADLLSAMIYQGKIIYFIHKMMPNESIANLMNYTAEQENWCKMNEHIMWSYIIENKHLFSTNYRTIRDYIGSAPFTRGFPSESPGRTGTWIGFQIVSKYMENTGIQLNKLLQNTDSRQILKLSKYTP